MNKHLSLWQKLKIKYCFHWMDYEYHFPQRELWIPPTFFLTHSEKGIQRKLAALEVKRQKFLKKREQSIRELTELLEDIRKKEGVKNDNSSSSDS